MKLAPLATRIRGAWHVLTSMPINKTIIDQLPRYSARSLPRSISSDLSSRNRFSRVVAIVSEWQRGCTCADDGKPWECRPCTESMYRAIARAFRECTYEFIGPEETE